VHTALKNEEADSLMTGSLYCRSIATTLRSYTTAVLDMIVVGHDCCESNVALAAVFIEQT
jgi:hypothetical protein